MCLIQYIVYNIYIYIRRRFLDREFNDFCDDLEHVMISLNFFYNPNNLLEFYEQTLVFKHCFSLHFFSLHRISLDIISNDLLSENICLFRKIN